MKELETTYIQAPQQWQAGNGQAIKEKLLRIATKQCEFYATDVLVLIDCLNKQMTEDFFTLEIGFRQMGIDWPINEDVSYRYVCKLVKTNTKLSLFGKVGSV